MLIGKNSFSNPQNFSSSKPISVIRGENLLLSICRPRIDSDKGTAPCSGCQLPEKRKNKFQ